MSEFDPNKPLEPGMRAKLRHGDSPAMTVSYVTAGKATCHWFQDGHFGIADLPVEIIYNAELFRQTINGRRIVRELQADGTWNTIFADPDAPPPPPPPPPVVPDPEPPVPVNDPAGQPLMPAFGTQQGG
jgi:hypothetical protein